MASTDVQTAPSVDVEFPYDGIAVVVLRGEHDLSTAARIVDAIEQASSQDRVIVDFTECTFVDSTAIATLVAASHDLASLNGLFILAVPDRARVARRVLGITKLDQEVCVVRSRGMAFARMRRAA